MSPSPSSRRSLLLPCSPQCFYIPHGHHANRTALDVASGIAHPVLDPALHLQVRRPQPFENIRSGIPEAAFVRFKQPSPDLLQPPGILVGADVRERKRRGGTLSLDTSVETMKINLTSQSPPTIEIVVNTGLPVPLNTPLWEACNETLHETRIYADVVNCTSSSGDGRVTLTFAEGHAPEVTLRLARITVSARG